MIWLITAPFLAVLLREAQSQSVSVTTVPSVFASPNLANDFLQCLTSGIGDSPAFPSQEQEDLDAIAQVILNAVSSNTGATASARAQALSTALASSLTDLLISESTGNNYNDQVSILTGILSNCFVRTTGTDNPSFVARIQSLISVLSQNANAIPSEGALAAGGATAAGGAAAGIGFASGSAASAFRQAASQSGSRSASRSGSKSSSSSTTTSTSGSEDSSDSSSSSESQESASSFAQQSSSSLAYSSSFASAFSSAASLSAVSNVGYQLGMGVASSLGIANAQALASAVSQAVSAVGVGASASAYAGAVSSAVGQFLVGQGVLNAANAGSLASSFASAVSSSAGSVGNLVSASPSVGLISVGGPFAVTGQVLPGTLQAALAPVVSASGLASSSSIARVGSLAQSIASAVSSSGGTLSVPTFLNLLSSIGSQVRASSSSFTSSEVTSQVLLEGVAALLQVINGAQIMSVNLANVPNVTDALVAALAA